MGKSSLKIVTSEVKNFFKEVIEAPPELEKQKIFEEEVAEETAEELTLVEEKEECKEVIEIPNAVDDGQEVLAQLNSATSRWKETGDLQVHLEPPVPLRTRMKERLHSWKEKSAPHLHHLHDATKNLLHKFKEHKTHNLPTPPSETHSAPVVQENTVIEQEIMADWIAVLGKTKENKVDRQEIEQLYKQLSDV